MMSPLVTLNSRSCVIACNTAPAPGPVRSRRPYDRAAGRSFRGGSLVARDHLIDAEQIFGVARGLLHRFTDKGRRHQLVIALAVVALVRLQFHLRRELVSAERLRELARIQ